jgi:hypothetical protein
MSSHAPRLDTDGAMADPPAGVADQRSRPAITDRHESSTRDLHALPALLTVAETAEVLRVGRNWVYEHAAELGAVKLGTGQTAPLRIPRDGVQRIVGMPSPRVPGRPSAGHTATRCLGCRSAGATSRHAASRVR